MTNIYKQLRHSQIEEKLINVYQKDSPVVYTGLVYFLDKTTVVMGTYDEYGFSDGAVYLSFDAIKKVDWDSEDVKSMETKIIFTERHDPEPIGLPVDFNVKGDQSTVEAILSMLVSENILGLIITKKDDQLVYQEGKIIELTKTTVTIMVVDKFDLTNQKEITYNIDEILGIEFSSLELRLLMKYWDEFTPEQHEEDMVATDRSKFLKVIQATREYEQLIIINTNDDRGYFYVGRVIASNDVELVMQVVDMNGRFGGYVWLRYDDIEQIVLRTDYLKLMIEFVAFNKEHNTYAIPGLNEQRAFDNADNIMMQVIEKAIKYRRALRFQFTNQESELGIPTRIDFNQGKLVIRLAELENEADEPVIAVGLETIKEIAFGYYKAMLIENNIIWGGLWNQKSILKFLSE